MAQITSKVVDQIRADLEASTKAIYAKYGVDVVVGRISYNDSTFRCKVEGNVRVASGVIATPKAVALSRVAALILGKDFSETKTYKSPSLGFVKITGYNPKAFKYPFIATVVATGKSWRITQESAKNMVAAGAIAIA